MEAAAQHAEAGTVAGGVVPRDQEIAALTKRVEELTKSVESLTRAGFAKVDYFELVEAESLKPAASVAGACRIAVAAWLGTTRLIDNVAVARRG